jgi:4-diphosphocytidyl-2-C-methyl-D-erythritol kinase
MAQLIYRCYAKINLTLEVLRRRDDGYHDLASLVHTIGLADDLHIEPHHELLTRAEGLDIEPAANLVERAAQQLASFTRVRAGAELTLKKGIPTAAGLGGGSSDAATTLVGLNTFWGTAVHLTELTRLAAELGADVPFFVRGGAAVMRGRGEDLEPLPPIQSQWLVLVVPPHNVLDKTRRLYAALEPSDFAAGEITELAAQRLRQHLPLIDDHLTNAFSRAARAVFPGLSSSWTQAEALCGRRFFLSGAGPALFALARDRADARRQQTKLGKLGVATYAARTVKHARASIKLAADPTIGYS